MPTATPLRRGLLAAATATGLAAAVVYPAVHPAVGHAATSTLSVQYKAGTTGATADESEPWLKVANTSGSAIALNGVKLRYYFSADTTGAYRFACAWAVVGCSNITGTISALANPTATADHVLEISFGSGSIAPGADTGDIQLRLWRADWQSVNQADDYSFGGQSTYTTWNKVTAYQNGALAFGTPPVPDGGGGTPPTSPPPTTSGALFDDFSYTGNTDPNLGAHGWAIRTSAGGPGVSGATWSQNAITFPSGVMQLDAGTDGTAGNTTQAEIDTTQRKFFEGTYAARVYFNDAPITGPNGDHVNETFYTISPLDQDNDPTYSELDYEYLPNGGWGGDGPRMYTTTWYTYANNPYSQDNSSSSTLHSLQGWHTLVMTVANGTVTYYIDGAQYFSTSGKYYPRKKMTIDFNEWFINGELAGSSTPRTWREQVDWVYYAGGQALTPAQVDTQIAGYRSAGTTFTDSVPSS